MEREFVSYEQAVALRDLGAGFPYMAWYLPNNPILILHPAAMSTVDVPAPLKSQVFRWFREEYDLHHIVIWDSETNNFDGGLFGELVIPFLEEDTIFTTYEEAEDACIDKLIELAKQQENGN